MQRTDSVACVLLPCTICIYCQLKEHLNPAFVGVLCNRHLTINFIQFKNVARGHVLFAHIEHSSLSEYNEELTTCLAVVSPHKSSQWPHNINSPAVRLLSIHRKTAKKNLPDW